MSGLAEILLLSTPLTISGCDRERGENTDRLAALGAKIQTGHDPGHLSDVDLVVISSAVDDSNPEVAAARERGIPVIRRAQMLGQIMRLKQGIAIAGTHGKTTTTSLVGMILTEAGFDPTIVVGGRVRILGTNARLGRGDFLVAEADEYDRSFLELTPDVAVITNVEADHLDCYRDLADIVDAFVLFANRVPFYGAVIACIDDPGVGAVLPRVEKRVVTYGESPQAHLRGRNIALEASGTRFEAMQVGPAHTVEVAPFHLDTTPVTCGAYAQFVDDGGYDDPRWWTADGWEHRQDAGLTAPLYWRREGRQWTRRVFGRQEPIVPNEPVLHVSWYEADAYARWAGRRLPTEAEWEKAARFDPATGLTRRYPWGNADPDTSYANLGQAFLRPAPAGSYPGGAAPCGARQLIGDVWEWTSSDFLPYPGFEAWPYKEYSEVFFGPEYKVLRGGSWATRPAPTWRP